MSLLENVKSQSKAAAIRVGQQLQESPAYQQAQDRYQNMSPSMQKLSVVAAIFFIALVVLYYPLSQLAESRTSLTLFEEKRNLIRALFKTYREASSAPNIVRPPNLEGLRVAVESILNRAELLPEQNLGISQGGPEGRLIPQNLVAYVLQVKLAKLNLRQIVDIGSSIAGISESVKMKDLVVSANRQDTRYYDVTYALYGLKVPEPNIDTPAEIEKPAKNSRGTDR